MMHLIVRQTDNTTARQQDEVVARLERGPEIAAGLMEQALDAVALNSVAHLLADTDAEAQGECSLARDVQDSGWIRPDTACLEDRLKLAVSLDLRDPSH
jgi:hypothetical protein